jgi:ceramide glucosyltransferase
MREALGYCGVASAILYLVIQSLKTILAITFYRSRTECRRPVQSLSVLTPILSGDPSLENQLRAHLNVIPPGSPIYWIIYEHDAEALRITTLLAQDHQRTQHQRPITILQSPEIPFDANPKAYKMQLAVPLLDTCYVCVLDDDTIPSLETLEAAIGALESADVYTGLPCYQRGTSFWSDMICHFVANNGIATYLATQWFGPPVSLNGMFYVMKTETLRSYGGFKPIFPFLCDDYALARVVKEHGGVIHQSVLPHSTRTHAETSRDYFRLFHRWFAMAMVLFRDQPLGLKGMILVLLGLPPFLLWLSLLSPLVGVSGWILLASVFAFRHLLIRLQHRCILPFPYPIHVVKSLISELLQPLHVLHASLSNTFYWRKWLIRTLANGKFEYVRDRS